VSNERKRMKNNENVKRGVERKQKKKKTTGQKKEEEGKIMIKQRRERKRMIYRREPRFSPAEPSLGGGERKMRKGLNRRKGGPSITLGMGRRDPQKNGKRILNGIENVWSGRSDVSEGEGEKAPRKKFFVFKNKDRVQKGRQKTG